VVRVSLYREDAVAFLRSLESESIDLILTDPPFMISKDTQLKREKSPKYKFKGTTVNLDYGGWDKQWKSKEEYLSWCKLWWKECIRVLKPYRHLVFFFDKAKVSYAWDFMEENGMIGRQPLFWIKENPTPGFRKVTFNNAVNEILWFTKGEVKQEFFNWKEGYSCDYILAPVVNQYSKSDGRRFHPTQKPVRVCSWIIRYLSKEGDLVADPFFGSGSVAVACIRLGRNFIGTEIDDEFYRKAKERIDNELKRTNLFD